MNNKSNYKKIYKDNIHITWDTKIFHVHHIDRDRSNNEIHNLVLIPSKLHSSYHSLLECISSCYKCIDDFFIVSEADVLARNYIKEFIDMKNDIFTFISLRDNLLRGYFKYKKGEDFFFIVRTYFPELYRKYLVKEYK
jgi:hypothetical protein